MRRARISQGQVDEFPEGAVWNQFIEFLSQSDFEELAPEQRGAFVAFWYDAEVQSGGNFQYLLNRGAEEARTAIPELHRVGAVDFDKLLGECLEAWSASARNQPADVEEFVSKALVGEFDEFDARYYATEPTLMEILDSHLQKNTSLYVDVYDA